MRHRLASTWTSSGVGISDRSGSFFQSDSFAVLMFPIAAVNIPYVMVGRKGDVHLPMASGHQTVQVESIEFTNRFQIQTDDARAALMLIDQGLMQWLLDCDRVSFRVSGPLVTALVKRGRAASSSTTDLNLLLHFYDGFGARVPRIVHDEFQAPMDLGEPTLQAMQMVSNLISR